MKPSYSEADLNGIDFLETWPGIAPYLRGPYPTMYVNQPWTCAVCGLLNSEDSNAFYRRNPPAPARRGCRSHSISPTPTAAMNSDHPRVSGDVGISGVAINSIYDMRTLFAGVART